MLRIKTTEVNMHTWKSMEIYTFKKTDWSIDELCRNIIYILGKKMWLSLTEKTLMEMINWTYKYKTIISWDNVLKYVRLSGISGGIYSITINNMLAIYIRD